MDTNALFEGSVREGFMEEITLSWLFLFFQAEKVGYYVPGPGKRRQKKKKNVSHSLSISSKNGVSFQNGLILHHIRSCQKDAWDICKVKRLYHIP